MPIVAGENVLTAYAFNRDNIKSTDATLVVTGDESLQRTGTSGDYRMVARDGRWARKFFTASSCELTT